MWESCAQKRGECVSHTWGVKWRQKSQESEMRTSQQEEIRLQGVHHPSEERCQEDGVLFSITSSDATGRWSGLGAIS